MLPLKTTVLSFVFVLNVLFTACVTINVYFPTAAAEKAADQFIKGVYDKENQQEPTPPKPEPKSEQQKIDDQKTSYAWNIMQHPIESPTKDSSESLTLHVSQNADFDISSPVIQELQNRMAERHEKLKKDYDRGTIGLTHDGLIKLRKPTGIPLKQRRKIKRWIAEENEDRLELYRQIAAENDHPEWEGDIRATFAKRWIEHAKPGWWYQDEEENWQRKK